MRIHHLNCGSLTTIERVEGGDARHVVCHCLLIETDAGLVLVDSGLGTHDIARPGERLGADWVTYAGPVLDPAETALRQVRRLGHSPADVRHIVLTHAHNDHMGGLSDFPEATVHLHEAEHATLDPDNAQLAHGPRWSTYGDGGDEWFGFAGARPLPGPPPEIVVFPLGGHTPGHAGVAVDAGDRWLLHAGDTYFYHGEIDRPEPVTHPLMQLVQEGGETDRALRLDNVARLRELARTRGGEVEVFSAHDPWEFGRLSAVS
ncbi:MBL fold metallo-hydrolase [Actinomadura kijaniata]|uniref:Glyoxylase-like metal-dependent hydrolase (Beta-lactamase superfamily II) n=1 Tax=Actinomadura namibiensis TaxID=182080 RepID=A0A7W3QPQ2_ACTNM|nr:MBL fold metallo-hydrolase [Actinomadura namibiensis]MBA8954910.1 glyoxylase-like metal-dependent hydrolase (beta-lactamase superfamily II) [Actinomadura namibiensis]